MPRLQEEWIRMRLKKMKHSEGQEQLLSELQRYLYSACLFSVPMWYLVPTRESAEALGLRYSTTFS